MIINIPKGTKDILPSESYKWQWLEKRIRDTAAQYGFKEIRTPMFEHTELFARGIGDTTDVVQKEMYTFEIAERSLTLKPEGTAGAARLFLESGLYYTQKGGKSGSGGEKFSYDLNYLEIPLLIKYKHFVGNQTSIQPYVGAFLAVGTDGNIKDYGHRDAFSSYENGYFKRFDSGIKLGCGVGFNMLYLDASYDIGLANIGQDAFDDTHTGCFTLNVGVNF